MIHTQLSRANLGMALRNNEEYKDACEQFQYCLKLQPGHPQITQILSDCENQYEEQQRNKEKEAEAQNGTTPFLTIENSNNSSRGMDSGSGASPTLSPVYHASTPNSLREMGDGDFNDEFDDDDDDDDFDLEPRRRRSSFSMLGGKKKGRPMKGGLRKVKVAVHG